MTDLEKYIIARWTYSIGREFISNAEYTLLDKSIKAQYPDNEYTKRSWSSDPCPVDLLTKYGMTDCIKAVVLSDKTESIESLSSYTEVKDFLRTVPNKGTLSFKMDGWNIQAAYYNGLLVNIQTRGRSSDAMDVSVLKDSIPKQIPVQGKVTVVMEGVVSNNTFGMCKQMFGNTSQRGAVSTLLARDGYAECVDLFAFDILSDSYTYGNNPFPILISWGFRVPEYIEVYNEDDVLKGIQSMSAQVQQFGYPTDGLVFRGTATRAFRVGSWEEPIFRTFVSKEAPYSETYGSHRIALAINVYPISRDGGTQHVIPVNNIQNIIDWNLEPGAPVAFTLRSHAIAKLDVDSTLALQRAYAGNYDVYQDTVMREEYVRRLL